MANTRPLGNLSVNPVSGYYGTNDPGTLKNNFAIPHGISSSRFPQASGHEQQTFLGASIRNFNINAGFGDSSSTLNIELVNDEYNKSDQTGYGSGDDIYHNGQYDDFKPPPIGSPVFFKFGKRKSSVDQAFCGLYKEIYSTIEGGGGDCDEDITKNSFCFGGILQSVIENRGQGGDPLFSVQVVDPREILSNVTIIMNDYGESVLDTHNLFNLYGFLEFNQTKANREALQNRLGNSSVLTCTNGVCSGTDMYWGADAYKNIQVALNQAGITNVDLNSEANFMPITGTGFSRRTSMGMPFYRIKQGLAALFEMFGKLPPDYKAAGFGGKIKFRGLNYIVDFGGFPANIPAFYCMDFDQINLLDLCLEICSITNRELFISLLPIINHPVCSAYYNWNAGCADKDLIGGIIRVESIDKSIQPSYGEISNYLNTLRASQIPIENYDTGFELTNVTTDKFVAGGQEVDMYFFSGNNDRGNIEARKNDSSINQWQWRLQTMFRQQILPYYGMIGEAVTIPKGFGAYQQILLDSSSLYAAGVGNYYVATEMELRAASAGYKTWVRFLMQYNDVYAEELTGTATLAGAAVAAAPPTVGGYTVNIGGSYGVSVPRSVWPGFNLNFEPPATGKIQTPVESCHPPYGYPLYYKRADKIGVNGVGLTQTQSRLGQIIDDLAFVYGPAGNGNTDQYKYYVDSQIQQIQNSISSACGPGSFGESEAYRLALFGAIKAGTPVGVVQTALTGAANMKKAVSQMQQRTKENSLRVYNWLKKIADECLGKKFLVKIPREPNLRWEWQIQEGSAGYAQGPFGFRPRIIDSGGASAFNQPLRTAKQSASTDFIIQRFLSTEDGEPRTTVGALVVNWNPIDSTWETNYTIDKNGGFCDFDLMKNIVNQKNALTGQGLAPIDMTKIMNGNRVGAYVRFDHSEHLAFDNMSSSDFTQQLINDKFVIPNVIENFDNVDTSSFGFYPQNLGNANHAPIREPSVAFVKCDVDDNFYFAPKVVDFQTYVYGSTVQNIGSFPAQPVKIKNKDTCVCETKPQAIYPHFVPLPGATNAITIKDFVRRPPLNTAGVPTTDTPTQYDTRLEKLDPYSAYALITLPGSVVPKKDSRFRDGPLTEVNADLLKHLLTQDVVKIPEFQTPGYINVPSNFPDFNSTLSPSTRVAALNARKASLDRLQIGFPEQLQSVAPSPVYPDLVVLPLMSKERCYGPWISSYFSTNRYTNLGGRVEFVKDENLAPWNFNGYDLMNQAGRLQASFTNSVLTQLERGGAVIPGAPTGVYLGRYLNKVGPLLTNLSVDVSDAGIKTTFKFDLYTVSFGKLAKHKQEQIAVMSRERQKLRDERNALVRKGLGKAQSNISFTKIYNSANQTMDNAQQAFSTLVISAQPDKAAKVGGDDLVQVHNAGSVTNNQDISDTISRMDPDVASQKFGRTAAASIPDMFPPVDQGHGANPYMHGQAYGVAYEDYKKMYKLDETA